MKRLLFVFTILAAPAVALGKNAQPGAHFIEDWDLDTDGKVTLAERQEKWGDVFFTFDADENDVLDVEEHVYFDDARKADMESLGDKAQGRMGKVQEGMMLEFNDADGDGSVSREEFVARATDWLILIDRNGIGDVTTAHFGPKGKTSKRPAHQG